MNVAGEFCANAVCPIFLIAIFALALDRFEKSLEGVIAKREQQGSKRID